eukprot:6212938-Pleurochrysis_carterae.AAC.13
MPSEPERIPRERKAEAGAASSKARAACIIASAAGGAWEVYWRYTSLDVVSLRAVKVLFKYMGHFPRGWDFQV